MKSLLRLPLKYVRSRRTDVRLQVNDHFFHAGLAYFRGVLKGAIAGRDIRGVLLQWSLFSDSFSGLTKDESPVYCGEPNSLLSGPVTF